VRYFDLTKYHDKLSSHHITTKSYYGTACHQTGAQLLLDMGYTIPSAPVDIVIITQRPAQYPLHYRKKSMTILYINFSRFRSMNLQWPLSQLQRLSLPPTTP
jgi:hypothetical protein